MTWSPTARLRRFTALLGLLLSFALALPVRVSADARSEYLIRLLAGSSQFRVRAQAAISLGSVEGIPEVVDALMAALSDEHPAVRAAAANSLGRLADGRALSALRAKVDDPEPPVRVAVQSAITKLEAVARHQGLEIEQPHARAGPPRYYVAIGKPGSRVPEVSSADLAFVEQVMRDRLDQMDGVVIAPRDESASAVRSVLRSRKLKGFYIDSAVTSVSRKPDGGVRVAVSVIVASYPDRAMRAIMQGAATATGGADARAQAVAGALSSALRQLPQAMTRD